MTGALLVGHPGVAKVAFTGSVRGGRAVYEEAARGIRPVTLELGGCSPLVVCEDAELDRWLPAVMARTFHNSGQVCFRINRALVHGSRHDEFVERVAKAAAALVVGDPRDEATELGPLVDREAAESVLARIADAVTRGARIRLDGRPRDAGGSSLLGPTLLTEVAADADVLREETFGPVLAVQRVASDDEAIARANDSVYGLAAFALTRDPQRARRLVEELEAGSVWVNALDRSLMELPFGGVKQSGVGVEKSRWGFEEYLHRRAVVVGIPSSGEETGRP